VSETSDWIRKHKCTFDILPVVELLEGQATQLGYELNLHAELPVGDQITPELAKTVDELRDRLGDIIESLVPSDTKAHVERVPFRRAVRFPKGQGKNPMVTRSVRVFHPDYSALRPGDREKLHPTEKRLEEMGFARA
jgi:hypothetical protein